MLSDGAWQTGSNKDGNLTIDYAILRRRALRWGMLRSSGGGAFTPLAWHTLVQLKVNAIETWPGFPAPGRYALPQSQADTFA